MHALENDLDALVRRLNRRDEFVIAAEGRLRSAIERLEWHESEAKGDDWRDLLVRLRSTLHLQTGLQAVFVGLLVRASGRTVSKTAILMEFQSQMGRGDYASDDPVAIYALRTRRALDRHTAETGLDASDLITEWGLGYRLSARAIEVLS